ncbi:MAG: hypothetical protein DRO76_01065 [Candidatus Altiarchaeales archaeon]|nr:MAG: hypothetical protein DRO76_01065 [Candidatus Altiarchaeales archaeon]HDI72762.1 hypothetical protein [Candidatus Altiarchaeales archaeon]
MDDKIDTQNIYIDPEKKFVTIRVNPRIYKIHTIMNAADEFIETAELVIDGDPEKEIIVKMIPKKKDLTEEELLEYAYKFNTYLISHSATR